MLAILDHEQAHICPVISLADDFFIAAHFAKAHPERVAALIACAGTLPLTRREQYDRMDKWHRFTLAGARYTPQLLPYMVKAGFALARRMGKGGFLQTVYGSSACDLKVFADPDVFDAMALGSEVTLSQDSSAHLAFADGVIEQEKTDWSPIVNDLRGCVPIHFINGLQDPQVPPETLKEHQEDFPWIDFRVIDDAGQLIFFSHWQEVISLCERYLCTHRNPIRP